ncbi:MAG TPA: hypothetical protein VMB02_02860 [Candidatus Aquilonibacter sp.]|nr:hypothetical protein [Candidatus Aquilonibacter sp.]
MGNFFTRHYELELDLFHIALVAFLIFFFNLVKGVQIGLAVAVALVFVWMFHALGRNEPPCGSDFGGQPIARMRGLDTSTHSGA